MKRKFGLTAPVIKTRIPGPASKKLCENLKKYESPSSSYIKQGDIPVVWQEAKGANIKDVDGNVFIDMTGAFCVAGIGHCNDKVVKAIQQQTGLLMHSQGVLNPNVPRCELVKKLAGVTPKGLNKVILVNTGAEAVELAIKTARIYNKKSSVIAFQGGFHGKTYGALTATSRKHYREPFQPLGGDGIHVPYAYCYRCPFDREYPGCNMFCSKYLENMLDDVSSGISNVSAIILEPIQGHDGWIVPPREFLQEIRRICTERKIVMIVDEIITGFGRTGNWFAVDYFGIIPDIMVLAKGIAGGFPISAVVAKDKIMDSWPPGLHSSTFLGNPVGSAACLAAISELENKKMVEMSNKKGVLLKQLFVDMQKRLPIIGEVRGVGMMIGVELVKDRNTKIPAQKETTEIVSLAQSKGIIVNQGGKYGNVLKMSPPFVITEKQIKIAVEIIEESIKKVVSF